jgi:hypothetical protein
MSKEELENEVKRLKSALYSLEAKLWVIECDLDHREKRAIEAINQQRAYIYSSLGWEVTFSKSGLMCGANNHKMVAQLEKEKSEISATTP